MKTNVLIHEKHGVPSEVIQTTLYELPEPDDTQVIVKMLYSPINPADINMLEGTYMIQPPLPCVLGNEGVGIIERSGKAVTHLKEGDLVIFPFKNRDTWIGLWAEKVLIQAEDLIKVPEGIPHEQAALLTVNPVTALQLLSLFCDLPRGSTIVQNAANSGVGRWVIAIAKKMNISTINIIRDMTAANELKKLGATHIIQESETFHKEIKSLCDDIPLALNAVGGNNAKECIKALAKNGTCVTYGAMSKQQIPISNGQLIFKNLWFTGFNRASWVEESPRESILEAYSFIFSLFLETNIQIPIVSKYTLDKAEDAILHAMQEKKNGKILFEF
jgi:trans-2-enoyl-CoA reductase